MKEHYLMHGLDRPSQPLNCPGVELEYLLQDFERFGTTFYDNQYLWAYLNKYAPRPMSEAKPFLILSGELAGNSIYLVVSQARNGARSAFLLGSALVTEPLTSMVELQGNVSKANELFLSDNPVRVPWYFLALPISGRTVELYCTLSKLLYRFSDTFVLADISFCIWFPNAPGQEVLEGSSFTVYFEPYYNGARRGQLVDEMVKYQTTWNDLDADQKALAILQMPFLPEREVGRFSQSFKENVQKLAEDLNSLNMQFEGKMNFSTLNDALAYMALRTLLTGPILKQEFDQLNHETYDMPDRAVKTAFVSGHFSKAIDTIVGIFMNYLPKERLSKFPNLLEFLSGY